MTEGTETPTPRNWTEVREWMNVMVAAAALLVAIVSIWTTMQISGLEDYFRSEITRRNSELNRQVEDSAIARKSAAEKEQRLLELDASTNRVIANYIEAQGRLQSAERDLSLIQRQSFATLQSLSQSRAEGIALRDETMKQQRRLDLFRRQRAYESGLIQVSFGTGNRFEGTYFISGEQALASINQISAPTGSSELFPYFAEIREKAPQLCAHLKGYSPIIPEVAPWPDPPQRYGRRVETSAGPVFEMTKKEADLWNSEMVRWNKEFSRISDIRSDRLKFIGAVSEYLRNSAARCACVALATSEHAASDICPGGSDRPQPPGAMQQNPKD
ncbi:hypothetical protein [Blastomonas sp.]|uniref:hypothetical protein n=1 Tax=Blastomonas sp. TaxID=1909299 RepID=UPI00261A1D7E|nr:hypothetical protein [Blastomonas sp.]MDM7957612.1 hypothetical protein [Blastomonas sp.]